MKMVFIGVILLSIVHIIHHYYTITDFIYGGLIGVTVGIMFIGLYKSIKINNPRGKPTRHF